jgi:transposase
LPGLLPRKRGPKGGHKLNVEVIDALVEARAKDASASLALLVELLRARFGLKVHPSSVLRALERQEIKRPSQEPGQTGSGRASR